MAEEEIQHKATEPTVKRSLTSDIASHFVDGASTTAGVLAVHQGAKAIGKLLHTPPPEPSKIQLPSGYKED